MRDIGSFCHSKMFKQSLKLCSPKFLNNVTALSKQNVRLETTETMKKHKWDLLSAVCLERHPITTKPKTELESKFQQMLACIEFEGSMKSDHELRHEIDKKQQMLQKKGMLDVDIDLAVTQTAQDLEDAGDAELAAFKFAPRTTEVDKKHIKNSLERKLDRHLLLLVKQKVGEESFWLPPQGNRANGESMRQTAERVLREACGEDLDARIYGNAPMGFYKYVYPKSVREKGTHGAKIFYYLARYVNGSIPVTVNHQWLDREELQACMPQPIHKSVSMFLFTE